MKWVTRERPKTDRIACPWLIRNLIDPDAEFLYVPAEQVLEVGERHGSQVEISGSKRLKSAWLNHAESNRESPKTGMNRAIARPSS